MSTRTWIAATLDKKQYRDLSLQLCSLLSDGVDLCLLLNRLGLAQLNPIAIPNPKQRKDNITAFLSACQSIGLPCSVLFQPFELLEGRESLILRTLEAIRARSKSATPLTPLTPSTPTTTSQPSSPIFSLSVNSNPTSSSPLLSVHKPSETTTSNNENKKVFSSSFSSPSSSATNSTSPSPTISPLQVRRAHSDASTTTASKLQQCSNRTTTGLVIVSTLSDDLKVKAAFKYSPELLENVRDWIRSVLNDKNCIPSGADLGKTLKDGQILCRVINALFPGSVLKIYEGPIAFKQIENVSNYLKSVEKSLTGLLRKDDLFSVPDLFEERNVNMVIQHLQALAQCMATKVKGYKGPVMKTSNSKSLLSQSLSEEAPENIAPSGPLSEEEQEMLDWINQRLKNLMLSISDLTNDLRNGVKLAKLVEQLSGGLSPIYNDQPKTLWNMMHNASQFLGFLSQQGIVPTTECTAQDIVTGNKEKILGLLKLIREHFDFDFVFTCALNNESAEIVPIVESEEHQQTKKPSSPPPQQQQQQNNNNNHNQSQNQQQKVNPARQSIALSASDLLAFEDEERKFVETLREKSGNSKITETQSQRRENAEELLEREQRKQRFLTRKKMRDERRTSGLSMQPTQSLKQIIPPKQSEEPGNQQNHSHKIQAHSSTTSPKTNPIVITTPTKQPQLPPQISSPQSDVSQSPDIQRADSSEGSEKDKGKKHHHHFGHHKKEKDKDKDKDKLKDKKEKEKEKEKEKDKEKKEKEKEKKKSKDNEEPTHFTNEPISEQRERMFAPPAAVVSFSGPAISSWPSLEMVLDDPVLRSNFKSFLESEFAVENLLFYDDVMAYKRRLNDNKEALFAESRRIFEEYCTDSSEYEINISWPTKNDLQVSIKKGVDVISLSTWDVALSEVVRLLRSDLYVRWYKAKQPPPISQPQTTTSTEIATTTTTTPTTPTTQSKSLFGSISATAMKILGAKEQVRARVTAQLFASEQKYVGFLSAVCELVIEPITNQSLLSPQETWDVFANLSLLLTYHRLLLSRIEEVNNHWQNHISSLGDIFLENANFFMVYSMYMRNYSVSLMSYRQFRITRDAFEKLLKQFEETQKITVEQVLEMPFQRLETYSTILRSLQKYTPKGHRDTPMLEEAVKRIGVLISEISQVLDIDTIKEYKRLLTVADSINGLEGQVLIVPGRRLVCQGTINIEIHKESDPLSVICIKNSMMFLFNDVVAVCKDQEEGENIAPYKFVESIPIVQFDRVEQSSMNEHTAILIANKVGSMWIFQGSNEKDTQEWLARIGQWSIQ